MIKLLLKTLFVMLIAAVCIPIGLIALIILPVYISTYFFPTFSILSFTTAMLLLLVEIIGIMYFTENYKK